MNPGQQPQTRTTADLRSHFQSDQALPVWVEDRGALYPITQGRQETIDGRLAIVVRKEDRKFRDL